MQHPTALQTVTTALARAGARPVATRSYQEALPLAILERIDAIVCEVGGAARDGVELVRTVRELAGCGAHLGTTRAIAVGELPPAHDHDEPVAFDDRLERAPLPTAVVTRVAAMFSAGASATRPTARPSV
jgi:CheY-like chemotaxis protein